MKYCRECRFCGTPFETTSATKIYCDNKHYDNCVICGKRYEVPKSALSDNTRAKTCSKECRKILRERTNLSKYGVRVPAQSSEVREKMEATNLSRYGVKHAAQNEGIKDKTKQTNQERYGKDYFTQTPKWLESVKSSTKAKFGVGWITQRDDVKSKTARTNQQKYGVDCVLSDKSFRDKARNTYKEKTGYSEPFANPDVIAKTESTNLQRYGVKRPLQNKKIFDKSVETVRDRYGVDNPLQNAKVRQRSKDTCIKKYGVDNYMKSDEGKAKVKSAIQDHYGVPCYTMTPEWVKMTMTNPDRYDNYELFHNDPVSYIKSLSTPNIKTLAESIGVSVSTAGEYIHHYNLEPYVDYVFSYTEEEILNVLRSIIPETDIICNARNIISPYEIDFYIPKYKLGIEVNPTATHNSTFGIRGSEPKSNKYHRLKSDLCAKQGIFLFHIFGWEWSYKQEIIISMLRNLLNRTENRVFARNTFVKEISTRECEEFLNDNHRQGKVRCPIRFGLFDKKSNDLVSVMTFSKMRSTIGRDKESTNECYELVRFCNRLNTSVIGGASKLFKHFLKTHNPDSVKSFSDIAHTKGNLYKQLGFKQLGVSNPGYVWVNIRTNEMVSRLNAQKRNIKKFLKDDSIDIENHTEVEIMTSHGYVQVFDSGTILWEYK